MKKRILENHYFIVGLLVIILTGIMTYPLIFNLNTYISGFESSDEPYGLLWYWWWLKFAILNHLNPFLCYFLGAPEGLSMGIGIYPVWTALTWMLDLLSNEVFAYNLWVILSFILSGIFMYHFCFYVIRNKLSAFFSAIVYAFCPYHFARSWQHLGLAQIQFLPLYLFGLIALIEKINLKRILLSALGLFLVASFDLYYAYFMFIASGLFIIYTIFQRQYKNKFAISKALFLVLFFAVIFFSVNLLPSLKQIISNYTSAEVSAWSVKKPFADLFSQSAKLLSYFLPAASHPIFGRFTETFIGTSFYGSSLTEHTLYLGWIPLILAFTAFKIWRRNKKLPVTSYQLPVTDRDNFCIGFFVFLAVMAWILSQPPWWEIGPIKIYMPSFFMYKFLPMFRAYVRFGIVVMLAVAALAGFGLKFLLERFKSQNIKVAITTFFCSLVAFEFWNYPPFKVIDVSQAPEVYYWLKEEPGEFVVAEYPLDIEGPNEKYKFYQTKYMKGIVNGAIPGSPAHKVLKTLLKLSESNTARVLKEMGVKFVLVHHDGYLQSGLVEDREELDKIALNSGLRFIKRFPNQECPRRDIMCVQKTGPIDVYEVIATPIKPRN